jgi:hypothetical protein
MEKLPAGVQQLGAVTVDKLIATWSRRFPRALVGIGSGVKGRKRHQSIRFERLGDAASYRGD